MRNPGRVLAVDYGLVRVGLAVSDELRHTGQPLEVITRTKGESLLEAVASVLASTAANLIVVGLPLRLDGSEGPEAQAARSFGTALEGRCGIPVVYWDERFSTTLASARMRDAGVGARRQRGVVDKVAAALILQSFLDSKRPQGIPGAIGEAEVATSGRRRRRR